MTTTTENPRKWLGLSALLAATLMDLLDATVLNIAGPAIHRSLGGSTAALQWFSAAYTLALAAGLLVGGRLGDMYGRRRMLLGAAIGFTAASMACAFAWSPTSLITARAIQGVIAAMMVPQCFGLLKELFPGKELSKAFAIFGPAIGLSTILGPVVAGALVNANLFGTGWRSVFLINLLLGGYTLIVGRRVLPDVVPSARGARLDAAGALLGGAGMTMLIYPLIEGRESGWPAWCFALMIGSVPVFALFALRQRALGRRDGSPLIDLGVFRNRSYTSGLVFILSFFGVVVGFSLAFGLFLQLGLGYSAMHASVTSLSMAVGAFIGSALSSTVGAGLGRRIIHIGLAVMAVGTVGFLLVLDQAGAGVTGWDMAAPLVVYGLGMGAIFVPLFDLVLGDVQTPQIGSASGVLECVQQFGAALGVAVLGTVFFNAFGSHGYADPSPAVHAAKLICEIALGLTAVSFLLVFLLPKHGAAEHVPQDAAERDEVQQAELASV
ncbi:MFS transporter [Actinospica sp. MGRD01-02]|uniref:MFS transporter n=1 Tax=Actinospica acidithermotolerans TaxID=2828514 RepID=A0A941E4X3_9ACTN|nr:MFS transporter [Actinospica acidithermotolerans]MBR7825216.1 MFS transporter [Actinospica acidithermotolerans]